MDWLIAQADRAVALVAPRVPQGRQLVLDGLV